ncbi:zinc finger, CCHC-type containing protein [Tanacetum coccineum]
MQPTLDIRYETPQQLKLALANYGVANGYQLWYMKNDWRDVLVYCGRNVEEERCADESANGSATFRRIYICFKGVKDGWLAGCRKVIELDGCFLKHTCRGELLTAMGRDANNQMYPIARAVVRVENADNWGWSRQYEI